ncbi:hypothetical protein EJ04DRAFT_507259 [Polyplosphaeria fusca]|uniref:Uncharacterized protein n=1 Tax=Polyplosphaeria fusca TaxID=682080 RepID=A0A9P4V9A7_9PLEO|nr:hypothetical protein EJ04DRAFT_507259 [Polyplosphaeria fusca]
MSSHTNPAKSPSIPQAARSPRSPALPHFEDPPAPQDEPPEPDQTDEAAYEGDDDIPYPEPSPEQTLLPPPNFNPFFTLIEDTTTGEHHHPFVHYVFDDDDPVITTAAAMRSLGLDETQYLPQDAPDEEEEQQPDEDEGQENRVNSPLPPPIPGAKERYLIVDLAADGSTIVDAQSLSPDWQITTADIRSAPSFDEASPDQGYMLKIQGVGIAARKKGKEKGAPGEGKLKEARDVSGGDIFSALDGLVKGVEGSLDVAGKITGPREDIRESDGTVLGPSEDDKGRRRASQA